MPAEQRQAFDLSPREDTGCDGKLRLPSEIKKGRIVRCGLSQLPVKGKLLCSRSSRSSGFLFFLLFFLSSGFLSFFLLRSSFLSRSFLFFLSLCSRSSSRSSVSSENNTSESNSNESSNYGGQNFFHGDSPCTKWVGVRRRAGCVPTSHYKCKHLKLRPAPPGATKSLMIMPPHMLQRVPHMGYTLLRSVPVARVYCLPALRIFCYYVRSRLSWAIWGIFEQ